MALSLALLLQSPLVSANDPAATPPAWKLDPVHTRVMFAISHAGFSNALGTVSGSEGGLLFDPQDWTGARLVVEVPLDRLQLGDPDWNQAALAGNLLDAARWPSARFVSTGVTPHDASHARVCGNLTLLALVLLRLGWRLYAGAPRPLPGTPTWQSRLAGATHGLLYLLILAMPLSGWLYDSASGLRPLRWYGTVEVPKLTAPDPALRELGHTAHEWLFWMLLALVIAHVGAAFYHHLFLNDATLRRMLPRRGRTPAPEKHDAP